MWSILLLALTCQGIGYARAQSFDFDSDGYDSGSFDTGLFRGYNQYYNNYNILRRLQALENNVRSGAVGGCESGVIGPFSPGQKRGQIRFRTPFSAPPAVSLALSDLRVTNGSGGFNFQVRPSSVRKTSATVNFMNMANSNLVSAYISYMACPSNSNQPTNV